MHEQAFESDDMSTGSHEDGVSSDSEYDGDHDESADDADQPQSEEIYREELDQDDEEEDAEEEVDLGGGPGSGGAADEAGSGRPQLTEAEACYDRSTATDCEPVGGRIGRRANRPLCFCS